MIEFKTQNDKMFINDTEVFTGFILDSKLIKTDDLIKLYSWAFEQANKRIKDYENCNT